MDVFHKGVTLLQKLTLYEGDGSIVHEKIFCTKKLLHKSKKEK